MSQSAELFVEDGLQAGFSAPLGMGGSLVGTDLDSAVVIADSDLRPSHFEVLRKGGQTALRAVQGELLLPDGTSLSPGQDMICTEPLHFQAGKTRFALRLTTHDSDGLESDEDIPAPAASLSRAPTQHTASSNKASMLSGLALVAVAGVMIFTAVGLRCGRATPTAPVSTIHAISAFPPRPVLSASHVARQLRTRLDAAGLSAVAVAPSLDGSVIVQGALFPEQMAAWAPIRQWFDDTYGTNIVLVDEVMSASVAPKLTIAAVWAGNNPYLIDDRGNKLFVGAPIGGGWLLTGIKSGRVMVQNGEQKVALSY